MMKKLRNVAVVLGIGFVLGVFISCGSSVKKETVPEPPKAPWELLSPAEAIGYTEAPASCPKATETVKDVLTWEIFLEDVNKEEGIVARAYTKNDAASGSTAIVLLKLNEEEKAIPVFVILEAAGMQFNIMEFNAFYAIKTGTAQEDSLFDDSVGEYFCFVAQ